MTAAWSAEIPAGDKLVLLALADCANDEGRCWPGIKSLCRKTGKAERSLQHAIRSLCAAGHLTREEVAGKGCYYTVHPQPTLPFPPQNLRPAENAPPQKTTPTPAKSAGTPAKSAGKPSMKHKEPSSKRDSARELPDAWQPQEFGEGTQSRAIVDGWDDQQLAAQLEHFRAHHGKKGDRFKDWQKAWSTWVLNSRNFRRTTNGSGETDRTLAAAESAFGPADTWTDDVAF